MATIEVKQLSKVYQVVQKENGLMGALKSLIHKKTTQLKAVDSISFTINEGEIVGFIGPNGAGKSTTVKMLSGILTPSSGEILINGLSPQKSRTQVVKNLGVVFGQRSQLYWDLRLGESFELLKRIYQIDDQTYKVNLALMDDILKINEFINTPVRQLSLGQRIRGDLAASMLHSPSILFLDEPTIGLDVEAKYAIRKFIKEINAMRKTTIILTTHDLGDIQELCTRLMIINNGIIIEDGSLSELISRIAPYQYLTIDFFHEPTNITHPQTELVKSEGASITFRFNKVDITAAKLIEDISTQIAIKDFSLEETKIDDVIRLAYKGL